LINRKIKTYTVILYRSPWNGKLVWAAYGERQPVPKGEASFVVQAKNKSAAIIAAYGEHTRTHGTQKELTTALNKALRR